MTFLVWRQHRKYLFVLAILAILYAAVAVPTGMRFWDAYQNELASCGLTSACDRSIGNLLTSDLDSNLNPAPPPGGFNLIVMLVLVLPFLLGAFIGAPLVAREYEEKTNRFVWTQGTSRSRWLTLKLVWVLLAVACFAGIITGLTTWWARTGNAIFLGRFDPVGFGTQGLVPVAYAVFAVSLAVAVGAWQRRVMPTIAIGLAVLLAIQIAVPAKIRPHYGEPLTSAASVLAQVEPDAPGNRVSPLLPPDSGAAWILGQELIGLTGQPLGLDVPQGCMASVRDARPPGAGSHAVPVGTTMRINGAAVDLNCLDQLGYQWVVTYHPEERYWTFQAMETLLYLLFSVIVLAAGYWLVVRRDA